ncbi:hypothetical protein BYT27DRAFT_7261184 [Phlegmacium glaucopus]|nr:hypothetical protein BYT27DRAFT_7261184 [Phlegmacium glaucopus]
MLKHHTRKSARLLQKTFGVSNKPKAATVVFNVAELMTEILLQCSWTTLVKLTHTSIHAREIIYSSVQQHMKKILTPFLDDICAFFHLIKETNCTVVSSTAWNVMTMDRIAPRDLNIIVPNKSPYAVDRVKNFLSGLGTLVDYDGPPSIVYGVCQPIHKVDTKLGKDLLVVEPSKYKCFMNGLGYNNHNHCCKAPSIIPVVISSAFTCQFNTFTAKRMYCFYPKLLSHRETMQGMAQLVVSDLVRLSKRGICCVNPRTQGTFTCGTACWAIWRRTEALNGVGIMRWGGYDDDNNHQDFNSLTDDIGDSNYKWRLGLRCINSTCPNHKNVTLV